MNARELDCERATAALRALVDVQEAAAVLDHQADGDPYLWGYGGSKIVELITEHVEAARREVERAMR